MGKVALIISMLVFIGSGCSFVNPITKAQNLARKGKYQQAIKILEKEFKADSNSVPLRTILAQAYSDYGLALCQDKSKSPSEKYTKAKEQFAMALTLNPNLVDARDMYEMIEKIQASIMLGKS